MTYLWAMVIVMAAALATEIVAMIGMGVAARGAARRIGAMQEEIAVCARPTVRLLEELKTSLQPSADVVRREGTEIGVLLTSRLGELKTAYEDLSRRSRRLRLRINSDSLPTVQQMQRGVHVTVQGVMNPIRVVKGIAQLARGVTAAFWLLRKVA